MFTIHPIFKNMFILALSWVFALVLGVDFKAETQRAENVSGSDTHFATSGPVPETMRDGIVSDEKDEFGQ